MALVLDPTAVPAFAPCAADALGLVELGAERCRLAEVVGRVGYAGRFACGDEDAVAAGANGRASDRLAGSCAPRTHVLMYLVT